MVVKQEVVPVGQLSPPLRQMLQELYEAHYRGRHQFKRDLQEKDWVLLLREQGGVVGFSTLQRLHQGDYVVFFSGDTLVLPGHRQGYDLPRLWGRFVFQQVAEETLPCLWFLICSGFRTYRFLPVFFRRFYPRWDQGTPADVKELLDRLAEQRYGELYDSHSGVIRLDSASNEELPARHLDEHAQFFLGANPGWRQGHELACLTWLEKDNLTQAGQRMVRDC